MTLWNWKYQGKIKFHKIGYMNYIDDETYNKLLGIVASKKEDIIQDFVSVITSFSARIYSQRRSKRKTEQVIKNLESENV